jgi:hypothetical protein
MNGVVLLIGIVASPLFPLEFKLAEPGPARKPGSPAWDVIGQIFIAIAFVSSSPVW